MRVLTDNRSRPRVGDAEVRGDPPSTRSRTCSRSTAKPDHGRGLHRRRPIHTAEFPTNWQLSTSRAVNVLLYLTAQGVTRDRLGAAGYADLHPIASNATSTGRAHNRRVDIVLDRDYPAPS